MSSSPDLLDSLTARTAAAFERVGPAVVSIGRDHRGSGVVIAAGRVLTNAHNLRDRSAQVAFADGRTIQGTVAGADPAGDLVVLDVDTASIEPVEWSDDDAGVGSVVFALSGSPDGPRISFGIVSSVRRAFRGPGGRPITGSLEHTAPLPRGASGGPLVDASGRLVGVNTHRPAAGLYLARAVDADLRARVEQLMAGRSVRPRRLGVVLAPPGAAARLRAAVGLDPREGLLVRGVVDGGPADRAGLRAGDLVVEVAGTDVRTPDDLFAALAPLPLDASVPLGVVRGAEELTVEVTIDDAEA